MVINVVLSGGVGSRLWPLSRKARPKQYLPLFQGQSLFVKTILRNKDLTDGLLVVGNADNHVLSVHQLEGLEIPSKSYIIEACPRNTAAAIAFAAFSVSPDDLLLITPSDHLIADGKAYAEAIQHAKELANRGYLVTFGLEPTHPETGYGYIECAGEEVLSFREKPNEDQAKRFLEAGNYLWNSGMFCFQAKVFLEELKLHSPEVYETSLVAFSKINNKGELNESLSLRIPSISVDYAVMEKSDKIKVVRGDFSWSDMGSFASIYDYLLQQGHAIDGEGNMVIGTGKPVSFVGIKNSILVHTEDALLVVQKESAQKVKNVYDQLQESLK